MDDNKHMNLQISPEMEAKLMHEAEAMIGVAEVVHRSARDYAEVLEVLENPPKPNVKLRSAMARYCRVVPLLGRDS